MKKVKILALVSALLTAALLYIFLGSLSDAAKGKRVSVVTAARDIPANTPITAEMLKTVTIPAEAMTPRAISDFSPALGKLSQDKIYAGEQIISSRLITPGEATSKALAYTVEPGKRAITIAVSNTSGVGFMLTPGCHVDLIGYFAPNGANVSVAALLIENLTVLAVDNVITKDSKTKNDQGSYSTITLQVTPEQALKLTMAQAESEIRAVLRSPLDTASSNQKKITLSSVLN